MNKLWALVKLNLRAMLGTFRMGGRRKNGKKASVIGALALMAGLALYLSGTYSFMFAQQLAQVGQLSLLMLLMSTMAVLVGMLYTVFAVQGIIFGGKDNDLMLSLPISAFFLMLARVLALYLENLLFTVVVIVPAGAAYLLQGGAGGIGFVLRLVVATPFLALLPTLLALLLGFVLSWMSSKIQRKALINNALYGVFMVLVFLLAFRANNLMLVLGQNAGEIQNAFQGWALPLLLFRQGVCQGGWMIMLGFCLLCLLPFLAVVWVFAHFYKRIVTGLTTHRGRSDYRLGRMSGGVAGGPCYKKRLKNTLEAPSTCLIPGWALCSWWVAAYFPCSSGKRWQRCWGS